MRTTSVMKRMVAMCGAGAFALGVGISTDGLAAARDAAWTQGTSAQVQSASSGVATSRSTSTGLRLSFPAAAPKTRQAWVVVPIPTPVLEDGVRSIADRFAITHNGTALIDKIEAYDGTKLLLSKSVSSTGNHSTLSTMLSHIFAAPQPTIYWGTLVRIHVVNNCTLQSGQTTCPAQTMDIHSAGIDFMN